jgi:hypothetical protein
MKLAWPHHNVFSFFQPLKSPQDMLGDRSKLLLHVSFPSDGLTSRL